jgi:BirA family biotin operon repressor/biotin-[acetyl-CoA-carboxylase] ligase
MGIKEIIWLESAESTNSEAFKLIDKFGVAEGTVVATRNQTLGRGQGKASWESEPGKNLTFSLLLKPRNIHPSKQFIVNQAIALGVREGVEKISQTTGFIIKWPNDIYYASFKVAGILIENKILGNTFEVSVVGVGINLNQEKFFSDAPNPISLNNITGKSFDVENSLRIVVDSIWWWYQNIEKNNAGFIKSSYLKYLLGLGIERQFVSKNTNFSGKIIGLEEYGKLILQLPDGTTNSYEFKEIEFVH